MYRTILFAALLGLCAPLSAGALMDELFDGKKPEKVGEEWFSRLDDWVNKLATDGKPVDSLFRLKDDKFDKEAALTLCCIDSADRKGLKVRKYLTTGEDARRASANSAAITWEQWEAQHIAAVYPVESNADAADVVGLACWLYETRKAPVLANRMLTVLWQRQELDDLRPSIDEFIREQQDIRKGTELALVEVWDSEFHVFRKMLVDAAQARKIGSEREVVAKDEWERLKGEYDNPETRTLTLEQLQYELKQWNTLFGDTAYVKDEKKQNALTELLEKIGKDITNVGTYVDLAEGALAAKKPDPEKAASEFEKARALDPASLWVVSKAAIANYEMARPVFQSSKNKMVGNEKAATEAIKQFERWLARQPDNEKVLLKLGELHHLKGELDTAKKYYTRVIQLDLTKASVDRARTLKDAADDAARK